MKGITAKQVLNKLKEKYSIELSETEIKSLNLLRTWVKRGIINGPESRIGVDGSGGRQGLYDINLPDLLAKIIKAKECGIPLNKIKCIDHKLMYYEEIKTLKEFN